MTGERSTADSNFHPSGWNVSDPMADMMEQGGMLRRLTDEEVDSLRRGEPVPNMIPQVRFNSLDDFLRDQNNFYSYFSARSTSWGIVRARNLQLQRFELLHPELAQKLVDGFAANPESPYAVIREMRGELFEAYQKMSVLVSVDDRNVTNLPPDRQEWALTE